VSGIFSEQGFVDRLVSQIGDRFRWVPPWKKWLEYRGGWWHAWLASENLQEEYRASVRGHSESSSRRQEYLLAHALSGSGQEYALRLLSKEPQLIARPEEFESEKPLHPPFPSVEKTMGLSNLVGVLSYEGNRDALEDWTLRARAHVESCPNGLLRTDVRSPDLASLFPLLNDQLGSYVTRIGPKSWTHFPDSLNAELAWQLTGTHVCFLDGEEFWQAWRKFPQVAFKRWLTWGTADWTGLDGGRYRLRLPRFYVVTGPAYDKGLRDGLADYVVEVRTEERRGQ
jgi:hypothetical protein